MTSTITVAIVCGFPRMFTTLFDEYGQGHECESIFISNNFLDISRGGWVALWTKMFLLVACSIINSMLNNKKFVHVRCNDIGEEFCPQFGIHKVNGFHVHDNLKSLGLDFNI